MKSCYTFLHKNSNNIWYCTPNPWNCAKSNKRNDNDSTRDFHKFFGLFKTALCIEATLIATILKKCLQTLMVIVIRDKERLGKERMASHRHSINHWRIWSWRVSLMSGPSISFTRSLMLTRAFWKSDSYFSWISHLKVSTFWARNNEALGLWKWGGGI